jgi:hypothetical protein
MNNKNLAIVLVLTMATSSLSLIMIKPTYAQSMPKPSVPEFSVKYIDNSYYVSTPSTITDQYGNNRAVQDYVENKTFEFSIKNQAFTSYTIPYNSSDPHNTGQTVNLMFNIRMKSHSGNDWGFITHLSDGYLEQSDTTFTTASYQLESLFPSNIPYGTAIDFQVQALIGYVHRYPIINSDTFNGTESDWSNTQTIKLGETSFTSPNPTPSQTNSMASPTPTVPELQTWTAPLLFGIMLATAGLLVYHKKHKHNLVKDS